MSVVKEKESETTKYDEMPYTCKAFSHVSIENMEVMGRMFNLNPPKIENARILDLGCGTGANFLTFAANYPNAEIIGVDLSKKEVEAGQKVIKALGLKNYDLQAKSILDVDESYGKFDYIISHGVFSWVPKDVQDKILQIMGSQLTPKGLAFVSFNALPGWNVANGFRHMLQFHSRYFETDKEKIAQSRAMLDFMKTSLEGADSSQAFFLEKEMDIINLQDDSFLLHEYLEKGNSEFYFSELIEMAKKQNLQFFSDISLSEMNINNLPENIRNILSQMNDIVRQEQYRDFFIHRRFRNIMLCRSDVEINRNISYEDIKDMYFYMDTATDKSIEKVDFKADDLNITFKFGPHVQKLSTSDPLAIGMLYCFQHNAGNFVSIRDIKNFISENCLGLEIDKDAESFFYREILNLIFSGAVIPRATKPLLVDRISSKPRISDVALYQIQSGQKFIFNQTNDSIEIDHINRIIIENMNGKNTKEDLAKILEDKLEQSGQYLHFEGKRVTDDKLKFKLLDDLVSKALHFAKVCGLLVG